MLNWPLATTVPTGSLFATTRGTLARSGLSVRLTAAFWRPRPSISVMQGMTDYQWKVLKRAVRERFDQPEHLLSLAAGRNAIREVVEEALQKPSKRRRSRVMRYLEGGSSVKEEPVESPVDSATAPDQLVTGEPERPVVEEPMSTTETVAHIESEDIDVSDWEVASPDV